MRVQIQKTLGAIALAFTFATSAPVLPVVATASVVTVVSGFKSPIFAGSCRVDEACDRQRIAAALPDYTGKKALTPTKMVCVNVLASRPTSLVLAEGRVKEGASVDGRVITSWRVQDSAWSHTKRGYEREICIPSSFLSGTVTLCNEENRSVWNGEVIAYIKQVRRVPAKDAACLLGKGPCAKFGL